MEILRPIPLQKFKVGERIVLRSDRLAGRPHCKIEIVDEILPDGFIRLKGKKGRLYPNHWERA